MTESNSFKDARIGFGGLLSGADEKPHTLFKIERTEGPVLYGDYDFAYVEDDNHFNIEIGPFGYVDPEYAGDLNPSSRQHFSAEECSTVEQLIRLFFPHLAFLTRSLFLGSVSWAALAFGPTGSFEIIKRSARAVVVGRVVHAPLHRVHARCRDGRIRTEYERWRVEQPKT